MKTIAVVNATGRQAASLIRVASAVGYLVRAQVHSLKGIIAQELQSLPNVTLFQGPLLDNDPLMDTLFHGAQLAFINTTSQAGDEVAIGRALADAAKRAGTIQHYIYSSMPDHSVHGPWPPVPLWAPKFTVENYVRQLELPATFVYAGIYNNNFTSLPYPLFQMELMSDGSFEWHAPFDPDVPLPWLDAEHDVGPTLLQIFKDGPKRWLGHRYFFLHPFFLAFFFFFFFKLTDTDDAGLLLPLKHSPPTKSAPLSVERLIAPAATSVIQLKSRSTFLLATENNWKRLQSSLANATPPTSHNLNSPNQPPALPKDWVPLAARARVLA